MLNAKSLDLTQLSLIKKLLPKNQKELLCQNLKINITEFTEVQSHLIKSSLTLLKTDKSLQIKMVKREEKD